MDIHLKRHQQGYQNINIPTWWNTALRMKGGYNLFWENQKDIKLFGQCLYKYIKSNPLNIDINDEDDLLIHCWFNYTTSKNNFIEWHEHGSLSTDIIMCGNYNVKTGGVTAEYKEGYDEELEDGSCVLFNPNVSHRVRGCDGERVTIAFDILLKDKNLLSKVTDKENTYEGPGGCLYIPLKTLK